MPSSQTPAATPGKANPAAGSNRAFSHTVTTTASPEAIWRLWTDVSTWKLWDKGLKDAVRDDEHGDLALGSRGKIIPLSGPTSGFSVTAFTPGQSYAFTTQLPLARLVVERTLTGQAPTTFRHDVSFQGPLAWLWAGLLAPGFRTALPPTMAALAEVAETA